MDQMIIEKIKENLLIEKKNIQSELSSFAKKDSASSDNFNSTFPEYGDDEEENAAEVATYSDNLSIEHTLESKLKDIEKALASMENGSYGICKYCKNPIEEKRLIIRPTSTSCVECKKKLKGET